MASSRSSLKALIVSTNFKCGEKNESTARFQAISPVSVITGHSSYGGMAGHAGIGTPATVPIAKLNQASTWQINSQMECAYGIGYDWPFIAETSERICQSES